MALRVQSLDLYQIYDSSGGPTLEAVVNSAVASCPGGLSRSAYEAPVLPTNQALKAFEKAKKELLGTLSQMAFDAKLAKLMPKLGAQATTALSLAFYSAYNNEQTKSASYSSNNSFPNLLGNVLGGGAHSPCKTKMSIQEILVVPRAKTLAAAVEVNFKVWRAVGDELAKRGRCGLGYEAAWSADIADEQALTLVSKIAKQNRAHVGIDVAASQFFKHGKYEWSDRTLDREAHMQRILSLIKKYKLAYVEDPVQQDDFEGFSQILAATKGKIMICGDDLIATHIDRLKRAARERAVNAVIIKPNQIGTVSSALSAIEHADRNRIATIISHRSRETPDTSICLLAQRCSLAKFGVAGIRTVKLNGLLRLWHAAGSPKIAPTRF